MAQSRLNSDLPALRPDHKIQFGVLGWDAHRGSKGLSLILLLCLQFAWGGPHVASAAIHDTSAAPPPVAKSKDSVVIRASSVEPEWRHTARGWVRADELRADVALEQAQLKQNHAPHPLVIAGLLILGTLFTLIAFSRDADWN